MNDSHDIFEVTFKNERRLRLRGRGIGTTHKDFGTLMYLNSPDGKRRVFQANSSFVRSASKVDSINSPNQPLPGELANNASALFSVVLKDGANLKCDGSDCLSNHRDFGGKAFVLNERGERTFECESENLYFMCSEAAILMDSGEPAGAITEFSTLSKAHDIFISYRRDGGEHLAGRVKDALENRGFSAFLDVEDLKSGKFNEALLRKIEDATDFIVILTPGCLERCKNEGDWLRREIRHAIEKKRNIVPVMARGFDMPLAGSLPDDIADLPEYNGLTPAHELFEASIDRLVSKYLKAGKKVGDVAKVESQNPIPGLSQSEDDAQRFAKMFAERPDVIAEVEAEASRTPDRTVAEFEKLLLRLEVSIWQSGPQFESDQEHLDRVLGLIERWDADNIAAKAFVAANRPTKAPYEKWRDRLQEYERAIGSTTRIRDSIFELGIAALPLVCAAFRRMNSSGGHNSSHSGFYYTGWIESELLLVMSRWKDMRALPFIADAILRRAEDMNGHNDFTLGIVRAVQAFGVDRNAVDQCFQRLASVTGTEILRERREKNAQ